MEVTAEIAAAREKWAYRGDQRPPFAEPVGAGEESVWDFPRPPRVEAVAGELKVVDGSAVLALTTSGVRVLETAGAPTYYFPPEDVRREKLELLPGGSICEWKGLARSYRAGRVRPAAWTYTDTFPEYADLANWFAFYPAELSCTLDGVEAAPQPGGYYGGWVLPGLKGPIKGARGSQHW